MSSYPAPVSDTALDLLLEPLGPVAKPFVKALIGGMGARSQQRLRAFFSELFQDEDPHCENEAWTAKWAVVLEADEICQKLVETLLADDESAKAWAYGRLARERIAGALTGSVGLSSLRLLRAITSDDLEWLRRNAARFRKQLETPDSAEKATLMKETEYDRPRLFAAMIENGFITKNTGTWKEPDREAMHDLTAVLRALCMV